MPVHTQRMAFCWVFLLNVTQCFVSERKTLVFYSLHVRADLGPLGSPKELPIYLLGHLWLGPKFQQAPSKGGSCLKVLEFEEEVEGCAQHQDHVHRLQV